MSQNETQSVNLPARIIERIEARLPHSEFESTSEYVGFVMEEMPHNIEKEDNSDAFKPVDEREVKDRLEALGYLED